MESLRPAKLQNETLSKNRIKRNKRQHQQKTKPITNKSVISLLNKKIICWRQNTLASVPMTYLVICACSIVFSFPFKPKLAHLFQPRYRFYTTVCTLLLLPYHKPFQLGKDSCIQEISNCFESNYFKGLILFLNPNNPKLHHFLASLPSIVITKQSAMAR
jgi:hypothetical protein